MARRAITLLWPFGPCWAVRPGYAGAACLDVHALLP